MQATGFVLLISYHGLDGVERTFFLFFSGTAMFMNANPPHLIVPAVPDWWSVTPLEQLDWSAISALPPLQLFDASGPALQQTSVRISQNQQALFVRFDCQDSDIWGTFKDRDDPIYDQEVVEVFLSPGEATPVDYYEFEVSPNGVLLDVSVHNPTGDREQMQFDFGWNCEGIRWTAERDDSNNYWWAGLAIPWTSVCRNPGRETTWRANFYRIERPRHSPPEYSCWSPTMTVPADFHRPIHFGSLDIKAPYHDPNW